MPIGDVYTFFGSSQVSRFDGVVYRPPDGTYVVGKARWQPMTRASDLFADGRFGEQMTRAFIEMRVIRRSVHTYERPFSPVPVRRSFDRPTLFHYEPRSTHLGRVMVFEYGEVDSGDLAHEYNGRYRFDADDIPGLDRLPDDERGLETIDPAVVIERIRARAAPLFQGLTALRDAGFFNVFVMGLPPPAALRPEIFISARLRYKLNALFNREYENFSLENGIAFIPVWDDIMRNGLRDSKYMLDEFHLNAEAAECSLMRIHGHVQSRVARV